MKFITKTFLPIFAILAVLSLTACSPEVGSDAWCSNMKEKPSGDWSVNEAADYTKHCLLK
jgi:uncharacterized lipoprotein YehR (DUF1307 family)